MSLETSGADYLRRLKQDEEGGLATPAEPEARCRRRRPQLEPERRRRSLRYTCEGSAEFRVGGTNARTWDTFPDLSLKGATSR